MNYRCKKPVSGFMRKSYAQHIRGQQKNAKNDKAEADELILRD